MRKSLERCNKAIRRLKGNEGFSLVELIIVVAIMVALVAILAPQYFQYVERSRKAVDVTTASEILAAAKVAAIDPDVAAGSGFTVTWAAGGTGAVTLASGDPASVKTALYTALGLTDAANTIAPKSNFASTTGSCVITATYSSGAFTFTVTPSGWASEID